MRRFAFLLLLVFASNLFAQNEGFEEVGYLPFWGKLTDIEVRDGVAQCSPQISQNLDRK